MKRPHRCTRLIIKSREAALSAVSVFNSPQIHFKSETFIVLMVIAWTYAFHAFYRELGVDYRYWDTKNPRKLSRTFHGQIKHWSLEECLHCPQNPLDELAITNLKLLIGIRHQIEHQMTKSIDNFVSGKFQSCAMNLNQFLKVQFSSKYGLDDYVAFSLQFSELAPKQFNSIDSTVPDSIKSFIMEFESKLSPEQLNSPLYSFSMIFTRKLTNNAGKASQSIKYVDPDSEEAKEIPQNQWVIKPGEKEKYLRKNVLEAVRAAGIIGFGAHQHTLLFKKLNAKDTKKGYGVLIQGVWFWYDKWIEYCIKYCKDHHVMFKFEASA